MSGGVHGMPFKPQAAATEFILEQQGWTNSEVVLVGNSDIDMKTASTGQLMFLNATWHGTANRYGFQFASPLDVARFIDCMCLVSMTGLGDRRRAVACTPWPPSPPSRPSISRRTHIRPAPGQRRNMAQAIRPFGAACGVGLLLRPCR